MKTAPQVLVAWLVASLCLLTAGNGAHGGVQAADSSCQGGCCRFHVVKRRGEDHYGGSSSADKDGGDEDRHGHGDDSYAPSELGSQSSEPLPDSGKKSGASHKSSTDWSPHGGETPSVPSFESPSISPGSAADSKSPGPHGGLPQPSGTTLNSPQPTKPVPVDKPSGGDWPYNAPPQGAPGPTYGSGVPSPGGGAASLGTGPSNPAGALPKAPGFEAGKGKPVPKLPAFGIPQQPGKGPNSPASDIPGGHQPGLSPGGYGKPGSGPNGHGPAVSAVGNGPSAAVPPKPKLGAPPALPGKAPLNGLGNAAGGTGALPKAPILQPGAKPPTSVVGSPAVPQPGAGIPGDNISPKPSAGPGEGPKSLSGSGFGPKAPHKAPLFKPPSCDIHEAPIGPLVKPAFACAPVSIFPGAIGALGAEAVVTLHFFDEVKKTLEVAGHLAIAEAWKLLKEIELSHAIHTVIVATDLGIFLDKKKLDSDKLGKIGKACGDA